MSKYIIRLDDACEKMNVGNWTKIEQLLDKYNVQPLVGVIPHCEDPEMDAYASDPLFWEKVRRWSAKGWTIAMHGYNHVYGTCQGGLNPVHARSEFAGMPLDEQRKKVRLGVDIFASQKIVPKVFFAPSHTFDQNTLVALLEESEIRVISDTIANNSYFKDGFVFVPQQAGRVRKLPFALITFCYHPNQMQEKDFLALEKFLQKNAKKTVSFPVVQTKRRKRLYDIMLEKIYFLRRKIK